MELLRGELKSFLPARTRAHRLYLSCRNEWRITGVWNTWGWLLLSFVFHFFFLIWRNSHCCRFPPMQQKANFFPIPTSTRSGVSDGPTIAEELGVNVLNLQVLKGSYFPFTFCSYSPFLALLLSFHHTCTHIRTLGTLKHWPFYSSTDFHSFSRGETVTTLYDLEVDRDCCLNWWSWNETI